jgi:hypothetical protein
MQHDNSSRQKKKLPKRSTVTVAAKRSSTRRVAAPNHADGTTGLSFSSAPSTTAKGVEKQKARDPSRRSSNCSGKATLNTNGTSRKELLWICFTFSQRR